VSQVRVLRKTPLSAIIPKIESWIKLLKSTLHTLDNKPRMFDLWAIHFITECINKQLASCHSNFRETTTADLYFTGFRSLRGFATVFARQPQGVGT
jgi:hypothetical protein